MWSIEANVEMIEVHQMITARMTGLMMFDDDDEEDDDDGHECDGDHDDKDCDDKD